MSVKTFTALQMRKDMEGFFDYLANNKEVEIFHRKYGPFNIQIQKQSKETGGQRLARKIQEYWKKNGRHPQSSELRYKNNREMYDSLSKY